MITIRSLSLCHVLILWIAFAVPSHSKTISVDGSDADWTGTPPAQVHDTAISNGEWIYRGESGDARTDPADPTEPNYDLTEVRITADEENLYFLVRFADVVTTNEVYVAIGLDTDQNPLDTLMTFIGDDSGVGVGSIIPEWNIIIHNVTDGITDVELFADNGSSWFGPVGRQSYISEPNNLLEASVPLSTLGISSSSTVQVILVTFDNNDDMGGVGYANDKDTTVDYPTNDGLDVMGGTPGVTANAWDRDLNDGNAGLGQTVDLGVLPVEEWHLYGD